MWHITSRGFSSGFSSDFSRAGFSSIPQCNIIWNMSCLFPVFTYFVEFIKVNVIQVFSLIDIIEEVVVVGAMRMKTQY